MVWDSYSAPRTGMREQERAFERLPRIPERLPVDDVPVSLAALTERVTEIFLRTETLRALLIERCVFTAAEFDRSFRERKRLWATRVHYQYPGKRDADELAQLLTLLESMAVTK